jgi:exopolysaccharide biosynthesis polyprenyl glycosylphosphotransferase
MLSNANVGIERSLPVARRVYPSQATCKRIYQFVLLVSDSTMLVLAFALAYWLRFDMGVGIDTHITPDAHDYLLLGIYLIPIWLSLFALLQLYDFNNLLGGTTEYTRAINGCTSGMMLVIVVSFLDPTFIIARGWLVMAWLLSMTLICGARFLLRRVAYALRQYGYFISPILVVGTNPEAVSLALQLRESVYSGVSLVGFVSEHKVDEGEHLQHTLSGLPIIGSLVSLPEIIQRNGIEEVLLASTALTREQQLNTALMLASIPHVKMVVSSGLYEIFTTGMQVTTKNQVPLLQINRLRLDPLEMTLKTLLDYAIVLLALPVLLPIFMLIGLAIKLDSPGPVFHRRRVLGIGNSEFDAFKFRTMLVNGDEVLAQYPDKLAELQARHKLKEDPRVTQVGRWLRRTSLDELPQLINVLLGQMSLVGPRMIHPDEAAMYGLHRSNLLTVKPGLTGLWQVSGRSDTGYDERVQLDMHYIRNYSIWLDLQILVFQTLPAVFGKQGAY